jgi:hypothetical protein
MQPNEEHTSMKTQYKQNFPWGAVIWSSVLMIIIPLGAAIAISVGYGVVVGFQTRGDPEAINTAVMSLSGAVWYQALPKILLAAVAFWRGMRLAHSSASATLPVVSAAILALIGLIGTGLSLFNAPLSGEQIISFAVDGVIMLACGLAGVRIARR